jgi:hypothetical protein
MCRALGQNVVGSTPIMDHLGCDFVQVTLLRLPRPFEWDVKPTYEIYEVQNLLTL